MSTHANVPIYHPDLYSAAAIRDPYPHYARLRELGPVVWLRKQKVYALPRYAECKAVLLDAETFISGQGVGLNKLVNRLGRGTTLYSDGDDHARRRAQVAHRLTPRALRAMAETVERQAIEVVEAAVARRRIDGVEVATALPMSVVPDFVGWPRDAREHLLHWGGASFDIQGPFNPQAVRGIPATLRTRRARSGITAVGALLNGPLRGRTLWAARARSDARTRHRPGTPAAAGGTESSAAWPARPPQRHRISRRRDRPPAFPAAVLRDPAWVTPT